MAENEFEKTEQATPRRRQEARERGNVAKSQDLSAAIALLVALILLYVLGMRIMGGFKVGLQTVLSGGFSENPTRVGDVGGLLVYVARLAASGVGPLLLALLAVALVANVGQVGFLLTGKPLVPDFSRLDPIKGTGRLFDSRAAVRLLMSLSKVGLIGAVAVWVIYEDLPGIAMMAHLEVMPMFGAACELVFLLGLKIALLLLLLAIADYGFQVWRREKDLMMSKHEVKEELKRMEGDPLVRQRRTRVAKQLAMQRLSHAVPKADVVVTNPTHFAVALQYDGERMAAPKVVAKGADYMAMRIRQLAVQYEIPIIERKELARALYHNVEVGQEIPPEHYTVVAEILAYVYRLSGRGTGRTHANTMT